MSVAFMVLEWFSQLTPTYEQLEECMGHEQLDECIDEGVVPTHEQLGECAPAQPSAPDLSEHMLSFVEEQLASDSSWLLQIFAEF